MNDSTAWLIKPSRGTILCIPMETEDTTRSGIILVSTQVEKETHIVKVVEVCDPYRSELFGKDADGRELMGPIYQIGDYLLVGKYNGRDFSRRLPDGTTERFILIPEPQVLAKLVRKDAGLTS